MTAKKALTFEEFKKRMTLVPNAKLVEIGAEHGVPRRYSQLFVDFCDEVSTRVWNNQQLVSSIMAEFPHIFVDYHFTPDTSIRTKGFYIIYGGDESVGIFPARWELTGGFSFECQEEKGAFVAKLKETWEYACDTPIRIETFEEREDQEAILQLKDKMAKEIKWHKGTGKVAEFGQVGKFTLFYIHDNNWGGDTMRYQLEAKFSDQRWNSNDIEQLKGTAKTQLESLTQTLA